MAIDHDTAMHDAVGGVARTGHQGTGVPVDGQTIQGDGAIDGTALSEEWGVEYPLTQVFLYENAKTTAQNSKAIELLLQKVVSAPSGSASSPASLADVNSLIHRPSLFSGEQTEKEEVRFWLKTVERAVGGIITDSRAKAEYMGGCLRGRAQVLYESLIEQQKPSFEELSEFLIKYFGEKNVAPPQQEGQGQGEWQWRQGYGLGQRAGLRQRQQALIQASGMLHLRTWPRTLLVP